MRILSPLIAAALLLAAATTTHAYADDAKLGLGVEPSAEEIAGWDIDVQPDGRGLPSGHGTPSQGEAIFLGQCAACHGDFGEGRDRWPVLAGGRNSLQADRPEKTIGSYWESASTVFDYIRRAMPFGNAQSLDSDQLYALTAFLLNMNDVIDDPEFELNRDNFTSIKMPNANGFYDDDRETTEHTFWHTDACMQNCKSAVTVTARAVALNVTPDSKSAPGVD